MKQRGAASEAMRYIGSNSLKRLLWLRRRSFDGDLNGVPSRTGHGGEDQKNHYDNVIDAVGAAEDPQKRPTWKCFSYEEIYVATDGFSPGSDSWKGDP